MPRRPGHVDVEGAAVREGGAQRLRRPPVMAELGPHDDRLGLEVAARGIAARAPGDEAALDDAEGLDAEEGRLPGHQIGHLARLQRAHIALDAEGDRRVDGVFRDIALDALVVGVRAGLLGQAPALVAHLARKLPAARDDLVDPPHALAVGAEHRDRAEVVQHVFRRDGAVAHPALGEGNVFGKVVAQQVAGHGHVELFVEDVDRVGVGGIGRRRQAVGLAVAADDVGRVAAAGPFRVVHVDRAAGDRRHRILVEARFVQRVGVDLHREVVLGRGPQAGVDGGRHGAVVLVDLDADDGAVEMLDDGRRVVRRAAPEEAEIERPFLGRFQHPVGVPGAAAVDGEERPHGAADHGGEAARQRVVALVRRHPVHVHVDAAGRHDQAAGRVVGGVGAADQVGIHAVLGVGIAGLADAGDLAVLDADVGLHQAQHGVDDGGVLDQHVDGAVGGGGVGVVGHAVAHHAAGAGPALVAITRVVVLDLADQRGVAEPDPVALGRPVVAGIGLARDLHHLPTLPGSRAPWRGRSPAP